jgi:hypothetical protein
VSDTERWRHTAYWQALPRWKQLLLEPGNEDCFIYRYFPDRINNLKGFHYQLLHSVNTHRRTLELFPAGHGKTTLISTISPIIWMCRWPDVRILLIGKNDLEAEGISRVIQAELTDNEQLMRDFGPFKPSDDRPWSLERMEVAHRRIRSKSPTLLIVGQRSKVILGTRTDITICDDVVTEENSASPTQRAKMRDWFDLAVKTGPEHYDSKLIVVGTRFDPHDLYADLQELSEAEAVDWHIDKFDAVADEEKKLSLWPEQWPWERLMEEKAAGVLSFNKRYRNIAVDASRMVVKEQFITGGFYDKTNYPGCLDRRHKIGDLSEGWRIVTGFDPAAGVTRSAKFCAHMTLGLGSCRDHERCIWVIDLIHGQYTLPQQIELLLGQHEKYGAAKSIIEINAYQAGLLQALEEKMRERGIAHDFEPHYTTRTNKPDPELGVGAMSSWFEKGMVHIPWADAHSQRVMRQFVDEIVQYPDGRTSDTVMAFWFAWRHMQESMPRYESFNRLDTHRGRDRVHAPRFGVRLIKNPYYAREGV